MAQRGHLLLETLHTVVYFAVEVRDAFAARGLHGRTGYFAGRSAALGAVPPDVVSATFAVFAPDFVRTRMAGLWDAHSPQEMLDTRHDAVAAVLHRVLGGTDVTRAAELTAVACAALRPHGRPLYAAHAVLPRPAEPLMALWHDATLLREYRGDGHVAAMTTAGIHPLEAMILHGHATGTTGFLRSTRGWSDDAWAAASARLRDRGWLTGAGADEVVTEAGRAAKRNLERATRAAALAGWSALGPAGAQELVTELAPLREALMASDVFPPGSPLKPVR